MILEIMTTDTFTFNWTITREQCLWSKTTDWKNTKRYRKKVYSNERIIFCDQVVHKDSVFESNWSMKTQSMERLMKHIVLKIIFYKVRCSYLCCVSNSTFYIIKSRFSLKQCTYNQCQVWITISLCGTNQCLL